MIFYNITNNKFFSNKILPSGIDLDTMGKALRKISKDFPKVSDLDDFVFVFMDEPISASCSDVKAKKYPLYKNHNFWIIPKNAQIILTQEQQSSTFTFNNVTGLKLNTKDDTLPSRMTAQEMVALNWLHEGNIGNSSLSLCFHIFPQLETYFSKNNHKDFQFSTPKDKSDFNRCLQFVETVNIFPEQLLKVGEIDPNWTNIINKWDDIKNSSYEEATEIIMQINNKNNCKPKI
jgi:hypothetical protein